MRGSLPTPDPLSMTEHPILPSQDILLSISDTLSPLLCDPRPLSTNCTDNHQKQNDPCLSPASSCSGDEIPSETWTKRAFPLDTEQTNCQPDIPNECHSVERTKK